MRIVGEAADGETAIDLVRQLNPDVVLMDITLRNLGGIDASRQILDAFPDTKVIALSIHAEKHFVDAMLHAGVAGYILKDSAPEELVDGVRAVMSGEVVLSAQVAGLVVSEYRNALSGERVLDDGQDQAPESAMITRRLHRPRYADGALKRTRLLERLERNRYRPLTLISAPAGYGKTVLASMWLEATNCASVWVSLDERDDDLLAFVEYLLAAVCRAYPTLELRTPSLLKASVKPSASKIASFLIDDLHQITKPFILALDDVHLIREQAIFDLLGELLRHPLLSVHLVLIGRRDPPLPIATMRAHGQVAEIRARDLRFAPTETAQLLGRMLDRDIDSEIAAEWTERTEGWVTALRMAALSLRHGDQTDDLSIGMVAGSGYVEEYLFTDVLAHLPPANTEWLLKVSLLGRFCAPLCEAVCRAEGPVEGSELTGKEFVRWLQDENLFLVSLDDRGQWLRFHHVFQRLLQDALRDQLAPDEIAGLYLRASNWCAENGLLEEAIPYALSAEEPAVAARLVVRHRYALMNAEQWQRLDRLFELLPADEMAQNPLLLNARAFLLLHHGREQEAFAAQQQAKLLLAGSTPVGEPTLEDEERRNAQAELGVLSFFEDFRAEQPARFVSKAKESLEVLSPQALHVRAVAIATMGFGLQWSGDVTGHIEVLREALRNPARPAGIRARLFHSLATAYSMQGDLNQVLELGSECLRIAEDHDLPAPMSWGRYHLGTAHYLRNELAQAERYLIALVEDHALSPETHLAFGASALALLHHSQGRGSEATQTIELVSTFFQGTERTATNALVDAFRLELAIRRGDLAEAYQLSKRTAATVRLPRWYFYLPQLSQLKLLLAQGTPGSLADACIRLESLDEELRERSMSNARLDVLAVLALVQDALGEEQAALNKLSAALDLGEPGGFIRNFVDLGPPMADLLRRLHRQEEAVQSRSLPYLTQILAAFPDADQASARTAPASGAARATVDHSEGDLPSPVSPVEPLTERESQILRLLATELSPKEMAGDLFLSVHTVRTHIRNIYAKLDVHSRFEAVERAKELGLL